MTLAIYTRVSTDFQKDRYSLPEQKRLGIEFAEKMSWDYKVYQDVISGSKVEREALDELLLDIRDKKIDKLFVTELSRLDRAEEAESFWIKEQLIKNEVEIYENGIKFNLNDIYQDAMYSMRKVFDRLERKQLALRTKRGLRSKKDKGESVFSRLYGYRLVTDGKGNKVWTVEESEAKVIREIYNYFLSGYSFKKIAVTLNERLIPTRYSNKWFVPSVIRVMEKPQYCGYIYNSDHELIKSTIYEPIVTLKEFKEAQYYWKNEKVNNHPNIFSMSKHLCSALIVCGACGIPFLHNKVGKSRQINSRIINYYQCRHDTSCTIEKKKYQLVERHIDHIFSTIYYLIFFEYDEIKKFLTEQKLKIEENKAKNNKDLERIESELKENDREKDKLILSVQKSILEPEDIFDHMQELKKREKELQDKRNKIRRDNVLLDSEFETVIMEFKENSLLEYVNSETAKKRMMLKKVLDTAILYENELTISLITGRKYKIEVPERAKKKGDTFYNIKVVSDTEGFEVKTERDEKFKKAMDIHKIRTIKVNGNTGDFVINEDENKRFIYIKNWIDEVKRSEGKAIRPL